MGEMISIGDHNWEQFVDDTHGRAKGLVPRNYETHPIGHYETIQAFNLPLMSDADIQAAIQKKNVDKSWLSDLRDIGMYGQPIPSRDQNGKGYCWAHSSVSACLLIRARDAQPYADLSAYMVACIIKGYRDEGGWGAESSDFIAKNGVPTSQFWPQQSMSRSNDNSAMRENAAKHKITSAWMDLEPNNDRQLATCLCHNIPVVTDFNWWSHSVCACRLVSWQPLSIWIWNSWGDSYGQNGMGVLTGSKASADGMVAPYVLSASNS